MLARTSIPLKDHKTIWESRKLHLKRFSIFFSLNQMMWTAEIQMNEYVTIAVNRNLSNCENSPKKRFFGASTGFEPVASALALQCSPSWAMKTHILEAGQFIEFTALWIYWEHCSANAEATGSNPVEAPKNFFSGYFRNCLNCDSLRWSHTHSFVFPQFTSFDSVFLFLSRVDELNKLASLQYMGLHSSAGRALQR